MSSSESGGHQRAAFRSTAVVTDFDGKVECVTHYSSRVVVGSKDGRLVMYDTRKGTNTPGASYTFPHGQRVEQLLAVPHIRMLMVVSNGELTAHGATDLKPLPFDFSRANTHQVRLICVNQRGPPHFRLGVALLKRKAIAIYQYHGSDKSYAFLRDFSTQDVPEAMSWYRNKVVVGYRKDYFLLNDKSGEATPIHSPGIQDPTVFPAVKLLPKEEILVTALDRVGVFMNFSGDTLPKNSITWSHSPQCVEFSSPYILALVPRVGVEIHRLNDGGHVQTMPLPRATCMFSNGMKWDMEPRPSGDSEDVVVVGVRDSSGTSSVVKIEPMPLDQQVGELLDCGQIDEAQHLVRKSIASQPSDKQRSKIKRFQRQATVALLRRLEFDQAADYMYRAAVEPCEFLAFFPELQCASFAYEPSVLKPEVLPRGNSSAPDISAVVEELLANPRAPLSPEVAEVDASELVLSAQKALLKFLSQYKKHVREKARARARSASVARGRAASSVNSPKDARRVEAIDTALFRLYVHFKRYKELLALILEPNPDVEGPPGSLGGCALELESCRALLVKHKLFYESGQLLFAHRQFDEALEVFALLHHGEYKQRGGSSGMPKSPIEAAIDVLLAVPNTETDFILQQSIWILKAAPPKQALRMFTDRRPPLPSNDVVAHLREHSDDPAIVQKYLETLVKATGDAGSALLGGTGSGAGDGLGGAGKALDGSGGAGLGGSGAAVATLGVNDSYSHFLAGDNDEDDELVRDPESAGASMTVEPHHTRLALEYLDETLKLVARGDVPSKSQPGKEPGALGEARKRLLKFLKAGSSRYDVAPLVEKIKGTPLYNEFVILCGRGALHEEAVRSLVYELNDLRGAESYSVKYGRRAPTLGSSAARKKPTTGVAAMERNDALMELLRICFTPENESKKAAFHDFGFQLLARHGKSLDGAAVLEMVPASTPLAKLGEFFAQALPHSAHNVREMSIAKSLSNVYNLQVQCDRVERLTQSVQIDPNTLCPVCRKRIGDIVFAVYPNGKVVHYNCTNGNLELCPVTGERFS